MKFMQTLAAAGLMVAAGTASAQAWPARPVTILCWSAAGSPVDIYARTLAKLLTAELGQNVVVENRTGGSGIVMVNSLVAVQPTATPLPPTRCPWPRCSAKSPRSSSLTICRWSRARRSIPTA